MRQVLTNPTDASNEWAARTFSYLLGCAFGRWDVRIGRDPLLAPPKQGLFDRIQPCPRGMLVGIDGFPLGTTPAGYPLELPANGLLIDESGHPWDAVSRMRLAAEVLFEDGEGIVAEILHILGTTSIRDHLRRSFFKEHLNQYSMSRRNAPIYWQLTTPSAAWGVWIYAPLLSRETFVCSGQRSWTARGLPVKP